MKAKARNILRWDIPEYAKSGRELWTPKLVLPALVDAHRLLGRIVGRVGPRSDKAFWVEYQIEPADFVTQSIEKTYKRNEQKLSLGTTQRQVTRVGMVFGFNSPATPADNWLALMNDDERRVVKLWIGAVLTRRPIASLCQRHKFTYTTFLSRLERAAAGTARRLNEAGIQPWESPKLPRQNRSRRAPEEREETQFPTPRAMVMIGGEAEDNPGE